MLKPFIKYSALVGAAVFITATPSYGQAYVDTKSDIGTFQPVTLGDNISLDPCGSTVTRQINNNPAPQLSVGSICDVSNTVDVGVYYLISSGSTTNALRFSAFFDGINNSAGAITGASGGSVTGVGASSLILSSPYALATGAGSLFSTAGTYVISMITVLRSNTNFTIGGTTYRSGGDPGLEIVGSGFDVNGAMVGDFNGTTIGVLANGSNAVTNPTTANGRRNTGFSQTTLIVNEAVTVPEPSSWLVLLTGLFFMRWFHQRHI